MDDAAFIDDALQGGSLLTSIDDTMDDLFGDSADELRVPLGISPLPAVVLRRLDEMRSRGCCTTLTWAHTGFIAAIVEDGARIEFRTLANGPQQGTWTMSEASSEHVVAPVGRRFVHLQFNGLGIDMAAVDDAGCIRIYTVTGSLNRLQLSQIEQLDDSQGHPGLDVVVGLHWLKIYPQEFRAPLISPATHSDGKWTTRIKVRDAGSGKVHHPVDNRSALISVSSAGQLTLYYQVENATWNAVSTNLAAFTSAETLLTHAAIGENGDHLLLATLDGTARLYLHKILINWNATPATLQQPAHAGPVTVAPVLTIGHLATVEKISPQLSSMGALTQLKILPVAPENSDLTGPELPVVLAIFTHSTSSIDPQDHVQNSYSALVHWQVESVTPKLHEGFSKLKSNGTIPAQSPITYLRRQQDLITNKVILSVDLHSWNSIIALGASDGIVDFRERSTLASIEAFAETDVISSLPQSGFVHEAAQHHHSIALSTDGSMVALDLDNGQIACKMMSPKDGWRSGEASNTNERAVQEAAVTCLARQYSLLCFVRASTNDAVALLPADLDRELRVLFVKEVIRMTNGRPDVAMLDANPQQVTVLRDQFVPRALSAQMILGTESTTRQRSLSSQLAYTILNTKMIGTAYAQTIGGKTLDAQRLDIASSLAGCARWTANLMIFIVDGIASILRRWPKLPAHEAFSNAVRELQDPSIHLLLCSISRTLLRCHAVYIRNYHQLAQVTVSRCQSLGERQQLFGILEMVRDMPFTFKGFLDLVTSLDMAVRSAYESAKISPERRFEIELSMLTEGLIPKELAPALQALADTILPTFRQGLDLSKLLFWDTSMLNIVTTKTSEETGAIDAVRKTPLEPRAKLRRCRRCGAQTQDLMPEQVRQAPTWLGLAQRYCYCLDYWWID